MEPNSPSMTPSAAGPEVSPAPGLLAAAAAKVLDTGDPFRTALTALAEGVVFLDGQGGIIASNPAATLLLGPPDPAAPPGASFGVRWKAVREDGTPFPPQDYPGELALRTGRPQRDTVMGLPRPDGGLHWILAQADPVFGPGETAPRAVVCSFTDITHARSARQALELAKQEAEESSRVKDKFVSLLAHDLRAPIAAAMTMVQLVATDDAESLSPGQQETLKAVNARLQQQLELIDGVLSMTRLRTGKLRVHKRRVPAGVVLSAALAFRRLAVHKGIQLVNEVPEDAPFVADPLLFGQVVQNLVSNAIKFTPAGGTVRLFVPPGSPTAIAVQDTGLGIEPARVPDLFRADVKTSTVGTAGERGTGMGLPLSHDIVAAHGGTLTCVSAPGRGSTFTAELPPHRPLVLVVDDQVDLRALFRRYLARLGCEVLEAGDGVEALGLLKTQFPQLIVTDIQMPRMDGFALLDAIRRNPETSDTPVIVVTVGTDVETRDKAFALGANDFVTKPIAPNDFIPRARRFLT